MRLRQIQPGSRSGYGYSRSGKTYHGSLDSPVEIMRIAGVLVGDKVDQQWGEKPQSVDFFDIKSDVEALIGMTGAAGEFRFEAGEHPALQPGQAARIIREGQAVGVVGKLHPALASQFDLARGALLFELDAEKSFAAKVPTATVISRYPAIRRE